MATVLKFPLQDLSLRQARQAHKLSLTQAASALGVSPSTLDSWERGNKSQIDAQKADDLYATYIQNTKEARRIGKNVLFGCFPLRVARDILEQDINDMASEFGVSASYWTKFEANARCAPAPVIEELERRISARMSTLCSLQPIA